MVVMEFSDKGDDKLRENLKVIGAGSDLTIEKRVNILQQKVAELLTALQKAGIKTE